MSISLNVNRDYRSDNSNLPTGLIVQRTERSTQRITRNKYYQILWKSGDRYYIDEVIPTASGWERASRYFSGMYFTNTFHFRVPSAGILINEVNHIRTERGAGLLPLEHFFSYNSRFAQRRWPPGVEGAPITRPRRYSSMTEEIV